MLFCINCEDREDREDRDGWGCGEKLRFMGGVVCFWLPTLYGSDLNLGTCRQWVHFKKRGLRQITGRAHSATCRGR